MVMCGKLPFTHELSPVPDSPVPEGPWMGGLIHTEKVLGTF